MGLATIDPLSQKVLTEIQALKNVKKLQTNVWNCGQMRTLGRMSAFPYMSL